MKDKKLAVTISISFFETLTPTTNELAFLCAKRKEFL
jgi:hypothetical protein